MIKLKDILNETESQRYDVISGLEFKRKYITTDSGDLEKAYFENGDDIDSMGSVLGKGQYFSVTIDSSEHYENDDYYSGTDYFELSDSSKILLMTDTEKFSGQQIESIAKKYKVDGVYNPNEGKDGNPYLGLVIFNSAVIK